MKKPPIIEPIPFHPSRRSKRPKSFTLIRWLIGASVGFIFILLSASAWFVFTAKQVVLRIDPTPDQITIRGGLIAPRWRTYYLLRPGKYKLRAVKKCYSTLEQQFQVIDDKGQEINLLMEKLPGRLSIQVYRSDRPSVMLDNTRLYIDGRKAGTTPVTDMEVTSGKRQLELRAKNYQDLQTSVTIEGCGELQSFDFTLMPAWSDIIVRSVPQSAKVSVDGKPAGQTPLKIELPEGTYRLEISIEGFKTWKTLLAVQPNQPQTLDHIRLQPADGILTVQTNPAGANVTIGKTYVGLTPLKIPLLPNTQHGVFISKAGYNNVIRKIKVSPDEVKNLTVKLTPREGLILFTVDPADAELFIDGKSWGKVPRKLQLIAIKHRVEIKKVGYQPYRSQITPQPGFPQEIKTALTQLDEKELSSATDRLQAKAVDKIQAGNEYPLKLIRPQTYTMGSSRREQGRRSNETIRKIKLQRPFYMGVREVINKEFREFLPTHRSSAFKGHRLDRDELPVVQVTWEQAALFCNWLSAKESLPLAYIKKGDALVAAEPIGTGYRLPTEAEWEYCARFKTNRASLKYPWGDNFSLPSQSGNYADISAKVLLASYLEKYNDGYPGTAPPAKFKANDLGLYDLGGNVAEWCHDYYSIYLYKDNKIYLDPSGPNQGKHRIVRGSSWKHAGISSLRLAYRDYSNSKRPDLGFRICRYVE